ncbi:FRG domain-containing protein, partial [Rhodopseudomonas sp.]|uniref:FRG domain-containing protein n=1 Tax=Rhodopseudomonas sp. TaxID=1078 RepID=UPI003B3A2456
STFAELLEAIETFQGESAATWYRGCNNLSYRLEPSLYRHRTKKQISEIAVLETEVTTRFVQRSLPFLQRTLVNDWDKLFLMQHYGVPTRLLDWSENPFVAIYFALTGNHTGKKADASVWMCDPIEWNRSALSHLSFAGGILDESSQLVRSYAPGVQFDQIPMLPIMIYGTYNSPRIVAQRGGFALFGQGTEPMETVFETKDFPTKALRKIVIEKNHLDSIRQSLFRKGFSESVVFPDLDGLAREIRREFGF